MVSTSTVYSLLLGFFWPNSFFLFANPFHQLPLRFPAFRFRFLSGCPAVTRPSLSFRRAAKRSASREGHLCSKKEFSVATYFACKALGKGNFKKKKVGTYFWYFSYLCYLNDILLVLSALDFFIFGQWLQWFMFLC